MRVLTVLLLAVLGNAQQALAAPNHVTRISPRQQPFPQDGPFDRRFSQQETGNAVTLMEPPHCLGAPSFLNGVMLVSAGNILLNWFRPDLDIAWETRVPRILWESFLLFSAATLKTTPDAPLSYLLLSIMLSTTALIDIFFWAPLFGLWSGMSKEECQGGWFTGRPYICKPNRSKGYGRLLVTVQCLYGGAFYLNWAIASWGEYSAQRDRVKAERQARLFEHHIHHQR